LEEGTETMVLTKDVLLPNMQKLVDVCRVRYYPQINDLRTKPTHWVKIVSNEYICKCFLKLLVKNLDDSRPGGGTSQLFLYAAGQCAGKLENLVANRIFRGRLEEDWQGQVSDQVMEERRHKIQARPAGPEIEDGLSPFCPSGMIMPASPMGARLNASLR